MKLQISSLQRFKIWLLGPGKNATTMPQSWFSQRVIFSHHWYLHIVAVTTLTSCDDHFLYVHWQVNGCFNSTTKSS